MHLFSAVVMCFSVTELKFKSEVLRPLVPPCELGYHMKGAVFSDSTQNAVPRTAPPPQQFPLCAPWTSSVTLSELWTQSPHPDMG